MVTEPHSIWIEEEDWICLGILALYEKRSITNIIQELIYKELTSKKDPINDNRARQERSMSKRNVGIQT